ncbi:hypothetical protein EV182_006501 [Spiromyces aspiralis]|uniref:Uncharacterized protein n=1 Tax=Spiromyces aspiralis TaxID=68401 RepID=A0ACC1HFS3_9FUNG|nr:hypothetical protein EV182_006501 [Spiromyces aspiralis]
MDTKINAAPTIYAVEYKPRQLTDIDYDDSVHDPVDAKEVYELVRNINDPEHPYTLEQLNITHLDRIFVDDSENYILVQFAPTIPHCSAASLIGLCIRVRLLRCLPERFKVDIKVVPGSHQSEASVNKQLNDKERVAAALENVHLLEVIDQCLSTASMDDL